MSDSNESKISEVVFVEKRGPLRLFSVIAITMSCALFATSGCCFLSSLLFRAQVIDVPGEADEFALHMTDWTLPAGFSGKSRITINETAWRLDIAQFDQQQGRGSLVIAQLQSKLLLIPDHRAKSLELTENNSSELRKIHIDHSETRIRTIRDLPGTFEIGRGEDRASTTKYRQVIGYFRGKLDDVLVILQVEDGFLTDQQIDDFIQSIK